MIIYIQDAQRTVQFTIIFHEIHFLHKYIKQKHVIIFLVNLPSNMNVILSVESNYNFAIVAPLFGVNCIIMAFMH